ncbi:hypothetical protein KY330_00175 [Candidatus Woesearchaeota archaeon]|nr:hypothetical protein [Candidatus Woesearchaeota archaeon]
MRHGINGNIWVDDLKQETPGSIAAAILKEFQTYDHVILRFESQQDRNRYSNLTTIDHYEQHRTIYQGTFSRDKQPTISDLVEDIIRKQHDIEVSDGIALANIIRYELKGPSGH